MKNYRMLVQYDGTRYNGWQKQGDTDNTIQEKLETILCRMTGTDAVDVHGAGRTDAGVHARGQVAQFRIDTDTLRARTEPSLKGKVLGYVNKGIYNVGESVRADGYIWYKIEDFWCAYDKAWAEFLPKADPKYTLTMSHLNEAQKAAMVAWCEGEKVEYKVTEE